MAEEQNTLSRTAIKELLSTINNSSLDRLIEMAMEESANRLIKDQDMGMLIEMAMKKGFDTGGNPVDPFEIAPGIVALASTVKQTSSTRHTCTHYTVRPDMDNPDEYWSFDEGCSTLLESETVNVEKVRISVALHAIPSGGAIFRHTMAHDGERHNRKGSKAWRVDLVFDEETQEPKVKLILDAKIKAGKLPSPND